MTYKVGAKGQVVLPKAMREELGIRPGDDVRFDIGDGEITVRKAEPKDAIVARLVGSLAEGGSADPLDALIDGRRLDREREARKFGPGR
ncbi:MAG TPA: AbrB/MazE/SpoVT family DNA-binding domain-containing protein [Conexibacter sp.]|jgi:AbrB family looped-hinge helix DNA binding protein